jgi:hypothetical protein
VPTFLCHFGAELAELLRSAGAPDRRRAQPSAAGTGPSLPCIAGRYCSGGEAKVTTVR